MTRSVASSRTLAGTRTVVPSPYRLNANNMLFNPGFEYAPAGNTPTTTLNKWVDNTAGGSSTPLYGWFFRGLTGSGTLLFDNTTQHSGNYSFKVSTTATSSFTRAATSTGNGSASNNFSEFPLYVVAGVSYTLSYWMKTTVNSGSANTGALVTLVARTSTGGSPNNAASTGVTTTTGWTQYNISITPGTQTVFIDLDLRVTGNDGTGTLIMDAWFDDLFFAPTAGLNRLIA